MGDFTVGSLGILLLLALLLSAFFSASETALMSVSRHRLRHLAREGRAAARMAEELLEHPDRLVGTIMVCSIFAKVVAVSVTTAIMLHFGGAPLAALGAAVLTVVLIVFSEMGPKTVGALYPERIALPAAVVYSVLTKALYPSSRRRTWSPTASCGYSD